MANTKTRDVIEVPCPVCDTLLVDEKRKEMAIADLDRICSLIFNLLSVKWPLSEETKDELIKIYDQISDLTSKERNP